MKALRRLAVAAVSLYAVVVPAIASAHPGHAHGPEGAFHVTPEMIVGTVVVVAMGAVAYLRSRSTD